MNLGLGRTLPRLPRGAEQIRTTRRFQAGGGKGAHQALAARRPGADVTLLASVGRDAEHALADLAAAGVGPGAVIVGHDHAATGTAVPVIACGGSRIVVDPGAGDPPKPAHVRALAADSPPSDVVVTDHEVPALVVAALLRAYAGRARVPLSPSPARALRPELLALVALLILDEGELAGLLALDPAPAAPGTVAAVLERSGPGDSLVTLGSGGVVVLAQGATTHVAPFRVDATDKAGADDTFPGAFTAPITGGLAVHPTA
ncbi:PfkB family carbohydrate kinase [Streptomyces sp. LZ34]